MLGLTAFLALMGCATITQGTSQYIAVNTNPGFAECAFSRKGEELGTIAETPGGLNVNKTKDDILIRCNKKGYQETTYLNHSGVEGMTAGNILAGGLIGWGIDSATGSDNKYESPVNITLLKKD